jgi:hypothetical protein
MLPFPRVTREPRVSAVKFFAVRFKFLGFCLNESLHTPDCRPVPDRNNNGLRGRQLQQSKGSYGFELKSRVNEQGRQDGKD